jgi:hypothetical protein
MGDAEEIKVVIKEWISLDDENRELQKQQKILRDKKVMLSQRILEFMRENQVDNFNLEGGSTGTIARTVRQSKPPLKRQIVRTQVLLQFADQPQRVAEVLRAIEGIPEGVKVEGSKSHNQFFQIASIEPMRPFHRHQLLPHID